MRESGSIEQDADLVIFLYRPEYYKITEDEDGTPTQGIAEVIIAKHRNGSLDTIKLKFISRFTKFMDLDSGGFPSGFVSGGSSGDFDTTGAITFGSKLNEPPLSEDDDENEDEKSPF